MSATVFNTNHTGVKHTFSKMERNSGVEKAYMTLVVGNDTLNIDFHDFAEMEVFCEKHNFSLPNGEMEVFG